MWIVLGVAMVGFMEFAPGLFSVSANDEDRISHKGM